jgi:hypothetical protein
VRDELEKMLDERTVFGRLGINNEVQICVLKELRNRSKELVPRGVNPWVRINAAERE